MIKKLRFSTIHLLKSREGVLWIGLMILMKYYSLLKYVNCRMEVEGAMKSLHENRNNSVILDLCVKEDGFAFVSNVTNALEEAENELQEIEEKLIESVETVKKLTPECDKMDYILAATSGAICGVIDIFLLGKPGESPVGDITDKWFEERTKDFAKMCGFQGDDTSLPSAIRFLEKKFKIPYDQSVGGGIFKELLRLTPDNHHFKSLGHNPTLLGLFFSILNQFTNTSCFVSDGELITLNNSDGEYELEGHNITSKLFCGFVNWFGHLISDMSGSSSSKGRGMGIPSPLWSWTNDIIAIKRKLNIPVSEFDKSINELALQLYKEGYDARFQTAQAIPVFINEMLVRLMYSVRRLIRYFANVKKEERSFKLLWKSCEPFSNATVKRMLTVAHGTFCLVDAGDAVIRGFAVGAGTFNVAEFCMRLNIVGVGRFTISLYGEANRGIKKKAAQEEVYFLRREKTVVEDYMAGLKCLAEIYDDKLLLTFIDDLKQSDMYKLAFEKSVLLAEKRNVPQEDIVRNKVEIDAYFRGGNA